MPGGGTLGVTDGRATGELGYLHAVFTGTAVSALLESENVHALPFSDVIMSLMKFTL
ncbi:hypothetical protein GCM10028793_19050 [Nocardiopsis oceani]